MATFKLVAAVVVVSMLSLQVSSGRADTLDAAVDSYEHLAIVLVEVRKTEDAVVKTIITHHYEAAQDHLKQAESSDAKKHLELAAEEATNIANEGDKRVMAIRQRLAKAGSTHLTDDVTKEDYLWIDSKEKSAILALAKAIAQGGDKATKEQIEKWSQELDSTFKKSIAPEQR